MSETSKTDQFEQNNGSGVRDQIQTVTESAIPRKTPLFKSQADDDPLFVQKSTKTRSNPLNKGFCVRKARQNQQIHYN